MWVEQSYKQVKHALGWSDYQVRSDIAIRRHWQLVWCAFSFCWWAYGRLPSEEEPTEEQAEGDLRVNSSGRGKGEASGVVVVVVVVVVVAGGFKGGKGMAGAVGNAVAILEGVLRCAPTAGAKSAA